MNSTPPLILTLQIDQSAFTYFNQLRKMHFPASLNYLDAHLTLFHHLPLITSVTVCLETVTEHQIIFPISVTGLIKLGRGVAFKLQSQTLQQVHASLQKQWWEWLTPQDRQGFRPHVTIQNKVAVDTANALYQELAPNFVPFEVMALGLSLWEYQGGPWLKIKDYLFSAVYP